MQGEVVCTTEAQYQKEAMNRTMIVRLANYCLSSLWQRELLHAGLREA